MAKETKETKKNETITGGPAVSSIPVPHVPTAGPKRFEIRTGNIGFRGERSGVKFQGGIGETDDAALAAGLASLGYQVIDRETVE